MTKKALGNTKYLPRSLEIVYEDRDLLVVNKPPGLLTISTDSEKNKTVYAALTDYVKKGSLQSRNRIFVVHRIDRDTSGLLVFTKSEQAKLFLQDNWENAQKKYLAVTHGKWDKQEGIISSYLTENKAKVVYSTKDQTLGKYSQTRYKVIKETELYSLLEVELLTGRKNQIRVHFADENHPIVGDTKYGNDKKKYLRLALHSYSLKFVHPFSKKEMFFDTKIPKYLSDLVGGI